ncbi:MAG TPA: amidohydrolase family protein [Acidiphilium sp.]
MTTEKTKRACLFTGARLLDPRKDALIDGINVLIEDNLVKEVSDRPIKSASATKIELGGKTLMPGLIDAHIHILLAEVNVQLLADMPVTLLSVKGARALAQTINRGYTTIRDTGGADYGMKSAVESGVAVGPRMFISGAAISQTGGHADWRKRTEGDTLCQCCSGAAFTKRIADGVPEVIKAVRDELRKGADQIKIMVSGGVASQSDPLDSLQYRIDEIEAAVGEAERWGTYVCAHAYSPKAIERAVLSGVRTIEHGNLIDEKTARLVAEKGAFVVPTLVTYDSMTKRGASHGLSAFSLAKNKRVFEAGLRALEMCHATGVKLGFGTDLLGQLREDQSNEFAIRAEVLRPQEILKSCLLVNAEILRMEGRLGELVPGAFADCLVVEGDPYRDITILGKHQRHIRAIMKDGEFVRNNL